VSPAKRLVLDLATPEGCKAELTFDQVVLCVCACVKVVDDWGYVALVIDRVQLYVFIVVTVVGSAVLQLAPPRHRS